MRRAATSLQRTATLCGGLVLVFAASEVSAQRRAGSFEGSRTVLTEIIVFETALEPEAIVAILRAAIVDPDPLVREAGLAGVAARAGGPRFSRAPAVMSAWIRDRAHMTQLRELVTHALADPVPAVRDQALLALPHLDFDARAGGFKLQSSTLHSLALRYSAEADKGIRAKLVTTLGLPSVTASPTRDEILVRAFEDPEPAVRVAALGAAATSGASRAIALSARGINDDDANVRRRAAQVFQAFAAGAEDYQLLLDNATAAEADPSVREELERAARAISARVSGKKK